MALKFSNQVWNKILVEFNIGNTPAAYHGQADDPIIGTVIKTIPMKPLIFRFTNGKDQYYVKALDQNQAYDLLLRDIDEDHKDGVLHGLDLDQVSFRAARKIIVNMDCYEAGQVSIHKLYKTAVNGLLYTTAYL